MRYYIVDNHGNIWAESDDLNKIKAKFEDYTEEEKKQNELEIIEGE